MTRETPTLAENGVYVGYALAADEGATVLKKLRACGATLVGTRPHNPGYAAGYLYNLVKPRMAMATHMSYDDYVIPELVAEVRHHWKGPFSFGAPDMVVVNMTKDRIWVRDGVVPKYPNMAPPQFDMAPTGGLVVPAPLNRRQDVQEQSIRDAEIPPDRYYPKGYQPDMLPFWPSDKPIFLPENMVPEPMKKKAKGAAK